NVVWPILLIALGTILLVRPLNVNDWRMRAREAGIERRKRHAERRGERFKGRGMPTPGETFSGNALREAIVFGSLNRRLDTQQFEGGTLEVVFGAIEVDLSGAAIAA